MPAWLVDLTREKPPTISQRATAAVCTSIPTDRRLRGLVRAVVHAPNLQRDSVLHWAACRVGEMIADGSTDAGFAFDVLFKAASHVRARTQGNRPIDQKRIPQVRCRMKLTPEQREEIRRKADRAQARSTGGCAKRPRQQHDWRCCRRAYQVNLDPGSDRRRD